MNTSLSPRGRPDLRRGLMTRETDLEVLVAGHHARRGLISGIRELRTRNYIRKGGKKKEEGETEVLAAVGRRAVEGGISTDRVA